MPDQASVQVSIANRLGMHARPAMLFADTAAGFDAEIIVSRADNPDEKVDAKSIMQVMMLAATQGTELVISAAGPDAQSACNALAKLVKDQFGEA